MNRAIEGERVLLRMKSINARYRNKTYQTRVREWTLKESTSSSSSSLDTTSSSSAPLPDQNSADPFSDPKVYFDGEDRSLTLSASDNFHHAEALNKACLPKDALLEAQAEAAVVSRAQ
jgi:hypothetical protein